MYKEGHNFMEDATRLQKSIFHQRFVGVILATDMANY